LRRAIETRVPQARLDLSAITSYDDAGARLLAGLLAEARRAHVALSIERPDKLQALLGIAVKKGREGGQGAWLLALEMMQWRHDQAAFDDSAVDFAVAFEVSPPSWEPPPEEEAAVAAPAAPTVGKRGADAETFPCAGVLVGPNAPLLNALSDFAHRRDLIIVDLSEVERIDFVCAGALLNSIGRIETQRKTVQIVGASPIIRALLLLIGISPRHFVKKSV
jgi:anti-anti-sigma regulatory factor